jgi:Ca2+-transporting ATPase
MIRSFPRSLWEGLPERQRGLSPDEAAARLDRFGRNDVVEKASGSWKLLLRDTVRDPMLWFLAAAAALFAALGERSDAAALSAALVPLVAMDLWLHRRVRSTTAGLESRLAARARVLRGAEEIEIPAVDVVPGDLAIVDAGGIFPADGLILEGEGLHSDESVLTGEAWPVAKSVIADPKGSGEEVHVDAIHWGFAGTRLLTGRAKVRILLTGRETLYGEIARAGATSRQARTPLQRSIARLVGFLVLGAFAACVGLAAVRYAQGQGVVDALLSALSLAVAAMPEEFPVVFAVFLGVGVFRLARRGALVRRAAVVEAIGGVTCICSDKTGTITEGRLRVAGDERAPATSLERLKLVASAASPAEGADPLDDVLRSWASDGSPALPVLARFPFTEGRRRETVVARERPGMLLVAVKGAPETVLPATNLTAAERAEWLRRVERRASTGMKVIACASRTIAEGDWVGREPETDLSFEGLVLCEDPIRSSAVDAVRKAAASGIRVVLVTGDHPESARKVAHRIGLGGGRPKVVLGDELEGSLAAEGASTTLDVDVVARALPKQKLDLVRAMQARGEVVAVTGDGVNDVPALREADVGIAMGGGGSQAARDVASIVLLEDDLSTITGAVAEGRQLFENLRRSFAYLLAIHLPFVASAALIPLLGLPLLYLPVHIVWLELVIHPTALLAFQHAAAREPDPAPRRGRAEVFFDARGWISIAASGALLSAFLTAAYFRAATGGADHARAMAIATMSAGSAALVLALTRFSTRTATLVALATLASSVVLLETRGLSHSLHTTPPNLAEWGIALGSGLVSVLPLFAWAGTRRGLDPGRRTRLPSSPRRSVVGRASFR